MGLLLWVIAGGVVTLIYVPFVYGIEGKLASRPGGTIVLSLLTIFLWPIIVANLLFRALNRGSGARR